MGAAEEFKRPSCVRRPSNLAGLSIITSSTEQQDVQNSSSSGGGACGHTVQLLSSHMLTSRLPQPLPSTETTGPGRKGNTLTASRTSTRCSRSESNGLLQGIVSTSSYGRSRNGRLKNPSLLPRQQCTDSSPRTYNSYTNPHHHQPGSYILLHYPLHSCRSPVKTQCWRRQRIGKRT
jgi:hypothetical protein